MIGRQNGGQKEEKVFGHWSTFLKKEKKKKNNAKEHAQARRMGSIYLNFIDSNGIFP